MNDIAAPLSWIDANQLYLCAEFARLKKRLDPEAPAAAQIDAARDAMPGEAAIDVLAGDFGLTRFERDVLLLCAAVEMDSSLAELCAGSGARRDRGCATFGIALAALEDAHWSALSPARPLRRWRLVEIGDDSSLAASPLRIDERVLHYLAGINILDARLQPLLRPRLTSSLVAIPHAEIAARIEREWNGSQRSWPVVQLSGDDPDGQEDVAAIAAASLGLSLHVLRAEDVPAAAADRWTFSTLWTRELTLLGSALLIHAGAAAPAGALAHFIETVNGPMFVASRDPLDLRAECRRFGVAKPDADEQRRLWQNALGRAAGHVDAELDVVASQFRLSAQAISRAGSALREEMDAGYEPGALLRAVRGSAGCVALDELAQRIEPAATWHDLVLPEQPLACLRDIAAHVRHRRTVYQAWGFAARSARGLGITALFAGESGTGKTMAAEVLANDLSLDLYRIDLATVVSKYIGETEKNLRRVFDAAEESGAILLFDEADALFGKRSEVKDSHDRYANIEVSYLLQRMEAYRGLAILTTNMKSALDRAFQRRLRFIVQFPFPDAGQRERIWRSVFPKATPTEALDFGKLARVNVAGGGVRNIAMSAAFHAASAETPVRMTHLLAAARHEFAKGEKAISENDVRGWA